MFTEHATRYGQYAVGVTRTQLLGVAANYTFPAFCMGVAVFNTTASPGESCDPEKCEAFTNMQCSSDFSACECRAGYAPGPSAAELGRVRVPEHAGRQLHGLRFRVLPERVHRTQRRV